MKTLRCLVSLWREVATEGITFASFKKSAAYTIGKPSPILTPVALYLAWPQVDTLMLRSSPSVRCGAMACGRAGCSQHLHSSVRGHPSGTSAQRVTLKLVIATAVRVPGSSIRLV